MDFDEILVLLDVTERTRNLPKLKMVHDEAMKRLEEISTEWNKAQKVDEPTQEEIEAERLAQEQAITEYKTQAGKPTPVIERRL